MKTLSRTHVEWWVCFSHPFGTTQINCGSEEMARSYRDRYAPTGVITREIVTSSRCVEEVA